MADGEITAFLLQSRHTEPDQEAKSHRVVLSFVKSNKREHQPKRPKTCNVFVKGSKEEDLLLQPAEWLQEKHSVSFSFI